MPVRGKCKMAVSFASGAKLPSRSSPKMLFRPMVGICADVISECRGKAIGWRTPADFHALFDVGSGDIWQHQ